MTSTFIRGNEWNVHTKGFVCHQRGISGRVADCKMATWQIGKSARFSLVDEHGEFYCNKKGYRIPVGSFSLNRFERLSGIRAGIRTHKPKAPFETFYQSFTNGLI
ncbi:hypothetical protein [Olivibacter oleidegradans]|uniref:Uncharacterized protein n=1 Tax=Olivibacter oleidegradans TaxID=760123 RepID=A0ABV6HRM8_9SPHI